MQWYIERVFPVERRIVKTMRPLVSRVTTLPIAGERVFDAVERLHRNLDAVKRILTDETTSSVRLVVNSEKMVIAEARRTYTYLGLFGYRVDAVVVNRVLPPDVTDPYFGKWKDIQAEHLATVHESFEPVPILSARLFDREMVGIPLLEEMGDEVYGDLDAADVLYRDDPIRVRRRGSDYVLVMRLPFASRDEMDIHRRGEELFVRVGSYKRNLILPQTLKRMTVREANFAGITWRSCSGGNPARRKGAERWPRPRRAGRRGEPPRPKTERTRIARTSAPSGSVRSPDGDGRPTPATRGGRAPVERRSGVPPRDDRDPGRAGGRDRREGDGAEAHAHRHRVSAPEAVGVDVGGTKIAALRVAADGDVVARATRRTPADDEAATLAALDDAVEEVRVDAVVAIGVGAAGLVDVARGTLLSSPNLSWRDVPLRERLRATFALPVTVDNDATAGAWAEYRLGAPAASRIRCSSAWGPGSGAASCRTAGSCAGPTDSRGRSGT